MSGDVEFELKENGLVIEKYFPNAKRHSFGVPASFQKIILPLTDEERNDLLRQENWQDRFQIVLKSISEDDFNQLDYPTLAQMQPFQRNVVEQAQLSLTRREKEKSLPEEQIYFAVILPSLFMRGQNYTTVVEYPGALNVNNPDEAQKTKLMKLFFTPGIKKAFPRQGDQTEEEWRQVAFGKSGIPTSLDQFKSEQKVVQQVKTKSFIIGRPGNQTLYFVAPLTYDQKKNPAATFMEMNYKPMSATSSLYIEQPLIKSTVYQFSTNKGKIELKPTERLYPIYRSEFDDVNHTMVPKDLELLRVVQKKENVSEVTASFTFGSFPMHNKDDLEDALILAKKTNIYYTGDGFAVSDDIDLSKYYEKEIALKVSIYGEGAPGSVEIEIMKQLVYYPQSETNTVAITLKFALDDAIAGKDTEGKFQISMLSQILQKVYYVPVTAQAETLETIFYNVGIAKSEWKLQNGQVTFDFHRLILVHASYLGFESTDKYMAYYIPRNYFDALSEDVVKDLDKFHSIDEIYSYENDLIQADAYYWMKKSENTLYYRPPFSLVFHFLKEDETSEAKKGTTSLLWPREFLELEGLESLVNKDETEKKNNIESSDPKVRKTNVTFSTPGPVFHFGFVAPIDQTLNLYMDAKPYNVV